MIASVCRLYIWETFINAVAIDEGYSIRSIIGCFLLIRQHSSDAYYTNLTWMYSAHTCETEFELVRKRGREGIWPSCVPIICTITVHLSLLLHSVQAFKYFVSQHWILIPFPFFWYASKAVTLSDQIWSVQHCFFFC